MGDRGENANLARFPKDEKEGGEYIKREEGVRGQCSPLNADEESEAPRYFANIEGRCSIASLLILPTFLHAVKSVMSRASEVWV